MLRSGYTWLFSSCLLTAFLIGAGCGDDGGNDNGGGATGGSGPGQFAGSTGDGTGTGTGGAVLPDSGTGGAAGGASAGASGAPAQGGSGMGGAGDDDNDSDDDDGDDNDNAGGEDGQPNTGGAGMTGGMGGTSVPPEQCRAGLMCTADCSRSCDGGSGSVSCVCNDGQLFCGQCEATMCEASIAGTACTDEGQSCQHGDSRRQRCVCLENEDDELTWRCFGVANDDDNMGGTGGGQDPQVPACPADADGMMCDDEADTFCSADGANCACFGGTWRCFRR